jgi:hypothetical protein
MSIKIALNRFDRILGIKGWSLEIYQYPPEGSKFDSYSGRGVFTVHRYHISARLSVSSSASHGIHTVHDDLAKGIYEIIDFAKENLEWIEKAGVNSQHTIRTETRIIPEEPHAHKFVNYEKQV